MKKTKARDLKKGKEVSLTSTSATLEQNPEGVMYVQEKTAIARVKQDALIMALLDTARVSLREISPEVAGKILATACGWVKASFEVMREWKYKTIEEALLSPKEGMIVPAGVNRMSGNFSKHALYYWQMEWPPAADGRLYLPHEKVQRYLVFTSVGIFYWTYAWRSHRKTKRRYATQSEFINMDEACCIQLCKENPAKWFYAVHSINNRLGYSVAIMGNLHHRLEVVADQVIRLISRIRP